MARGLSHDTDVNLQEQETERCLQRLAVETDPAERDKLVSNVVSLNLGVCEALANRYLGRGAERDDLVQVARLALLLAIKRYRADEERPFLAFAVPTISGELRRYFRDHCWMVRPPRQVQELKIRARNRAAIFEQEHGRTPHSSELTTALGVSTAKLRECRAADYSYRPWSLDVTLEGHGEPLGAMVPDPNDPIDGLLDRLALRQLLNRLDERSRTILGWRFRDECSQQVIADRLGVSQMTVSRLLRQILDQLRDGFRQDDHELAAEAEPQQECRPVTSLPTRPVTPAAA